MTTVTNDCSSTLVVAAVPDAAVPSQPASLRRRAVRASAWRLSAYFLQNIFRIASGVILARLLFPRAFGLLSLGYVVMRGLTMFSELGIGPAIIQSPRGDDPKFLNTAWTLQSIRGFGFFAGACLLAWPAAGLYGEPELLWLVPVMGVGAIISGFNSTAVVTLSRQLLEGRRAVLDTLQDCITRTVMIVWAYLHPSVWAVVGGTLTGAIFFMLASHVVLPGQRNRYQWDRESAGALIHFSRWVFIGSMIAFFAQQMDRMLLGKLEAVAILGVYTIGMTLIRIPQEATDVVSGAVVYPLLAECARRGGATFSSRFCQMRRIVLSVAMTLVLGAVVVSPWFFRVLYDSRYQDAIWVSQLGAIFVWLSILSSMTSRALMALGDTRSLAATSLCSTFGTAICCLVGYSLWGIPGFVVGTAGGPAAVLLLLNFIMERRGIRVFRTDMQYSFLLALLLAVALGVPRLCAGRMDSRSAATISLIVSMAVLVGTAYWAARRVLPAVWARKITGSWGTEETN